MYVISLVKHVDSNDETTHVEDFSLKNQCQACRGYHNQLGVLQDIVFLPNCLQGYLYAKKCIDFMYVAL